MKLLFFSVVSLLLVVLTSLQTGRILGNAVPHAVPPGTVPAQEKRIRLNQNLPRAVPLHTVPHPRLPPSCSKQSKPIKKNKNGSKSVKKHEKSIAIENKEKRQETCKNNQNQRSTKNMKNSQNQQKT